MAARDTLIQRFLAANANKRKPPKDEGPPVRVIPGFGSFVVPYNTGHRPSADGTRKQHQWASPAQRAPYRGKRSRPRINRAPYSAPKRRPTVN